MNFDSTFSTWLYRIVVNTCYTALERKKTRRKLSVEAYSSREIADINSSDLTREKERKRIINHILSAMKPKEALLLRLYYLGEQSVSEIAEITDLSPSNIKVILYRARRNFHADLERLLGSEKKHLL
jgi:RNA polymerase sigma factor (sigma-70 family)